MIAGTAAIAAACLAARPPSPPSPVAVAAAARSRSHFPLALPSSSPLVAVCQTFARRAPSPDALHYLDTVVRMRGAKLLGGKLEMEPRYGGREACNHS